MPLPADFERKLWAAADELWTSSSLELALIVLRFAGVPHLSRKNCDAVKKVAADVPGKIAAKLVIDGRKSQRSHAAVHVAIKSALDELPGAYDNVFENVVEAVYEHVFESYWCEGTSKYSEAVP